MQGSNSKQQHRTAKRSMAEQCSNVVVQHTAAELPGSSTSRSGGMTCYNDHKMAPHYTYGNNLATHDSTPKALNACGVSVQVAQKAGKACTHYRNSL